MLPLCGSSPKKLSHGVSACLPNADSSLSGVAPLGLVKGPGFSGSYDAPASHRVALRRVASPHAAPKANSTVFQGFRVNARQTAPCASDETPTSRVSRCVHRHTSRDEGKTSAPTRGRFRRPFVIGVEGRGTRCYDCHYYCNYSGDLCTRDALRHICMRFCASAGRNLCAEIGCV